MHRKMTKFFSLFLSAAVMAGTLSVSVPAAETSAVYEDMGEEDDAVQTGDADGENTEDDSDGFVPETDAFASENVTEEEAAAGAAGAENISEDDAEDGWTEGTVEEDERPAEAEGAAEETDIGADGETAEDEAVAEETAGAEAVSEDADGAAGAEAAAEEAADAESAAEEMTGSAGSETAAEEAAMNGETVQKDMASVSIAGTNYYYVNTAGDADDTDYCFSVTTGRGASAVTTNYSYKIADLTQVAGTDYYYIVSPVAAALSGTLYGFEAGTGTATNYKEVYGALGVNTESDPAYDAVTSATGFSGFHAKDIPSLVTFGADADGNKAITGLKLGRGTKSVDAIAFVEASILQAAGEALSQQQQEALDITLKTSPMTAPADAEIPVRLAGASFTTSRYGTAEFAIVPDDTVEGYTWSEYWGSVYGAAISDGTTTAGAVHWIDLYGEAATAGPHYNKVEIALNNGESVGSNKADVSRYAAFFDNGHVKAGNYEITVYAEGYAPLTAQVEVGAALADKTAVYSGKEISIDPVVLTGLEGEAVYTYYSDAACTKALSALPKEPGAYYVKAVVADLVVSNRAKLTIKKAASTVTLKAKNATYTGKTISISKATVKGTKGKVTYTYYTDAKCTKKASKHVNAGTYYVKAAAAADSRYSSAVSKAVKLVIKKAAQSITASTTSKTFTVKAAAAKDRTFSIGAKASGKGKLSYKKVSGSKYLSLNAKNGKITLKKGTKKGTYTIKVKITAAANTNYTAKTLTKSIKVVVK